MSLGSQFCNLRLDSQMHRHISTIVASYTTMKTPWVPLFVVLLTSLPHLGSLTTTAPFIVSTTLTPPRLLYSQNHLVYNLSDSLHCISNMYLKLFSVLCTVSLSFEIAHFFLSAMIFHHVGILQCIINLGRF